MKWEGEILSWEWKNLQSWRKGGGRKETTLEEWKKRRKWPQIGEGRKTLCDYPKSERKAGSIQEISTLKREKRETHVIKWSSERWLFQVILSHSLTDKDPAMERRADHNTKQHKKVRSSILFQFSSLRTNENTMFICSYSSRGSHRQHKEMSLSSGPFNWFSNRKFYEFVKNEFDSLPSKSERGFLAFCVLFYVCKWTEWKKSMVHTDTHNIFVSESEYHSHSHSTEKEIMGWFSSAFCE